jgi:serine protease Do
MPMFSGEIMKRNTTVSVVGAIILSLSLGFFIGSWTGCQKAESPSEFTGFPQSFADLAHQVKPAVVNISTETTVKIPGTPYGDFFHRFFNEMPEREFRQQSLGSGFIVDKDGYIITNNHVVEKADEIKVTLADGRELGAKVIGRDPKTDLALIKISSAFKTLPTLVLGDSDKMRVGDWVLAIGNPFGLEHTVTQGIISATGRVIGSGPYDNFLQTDAPINPGNSGGPLVNLRGEVIGINSAITPTGQGIGFAIPANTAKLIIAQIREQGKVIRGWIGVSVQAITPEIAEAMGLKKNGGALVSDIVPGGPAHVAGIKKGDLIVEFDGKPLVKMSDLPRIVAEAPVGKTVDVKVIRNKKDLILSLTIAEQSEENLALQEKQEDSMLGVVVDNITDRWRSHFRIIETEGVVVVNVLPGSPAENSGIAPGDVIKEINRTPVAGLAEFNEVMKKAGKDKTVLFLVKRGARNFYITVHFS